MSTNKSSKHDSFDADSIKLDIKPNAYRFWTRRSMNGAGSLTQITMNKSQTNLDDCDEDVFPPTQMRARGWTFSTTATHATYKEKIHHDRHVTRTSSSNSDGSLHNLETHVLTQLEQVWRDTIEPSSPSFCEESLRVALAQSATMRQIFYVDGEHDILDEENIVRVAHAQHTFITDAIGQLLADEPHTVIDACVELGRRHAGFATSSRQSLFGELQIMSMLQIMQRNDASNEQSLAFEKFMRFLVHHMQNGYRAATVETRFNSNLSMDNCVIREKQ